MTRRRHGAIPPWIALTLCLLAALPARGEWWLWESPHDGAETVDQVQADATGWRGMQNGHGVGQSFVPANAHLERLDAYVKNRRDHRPITVTLWRWVDDNLDGQADDDEYAATVATTPVWRDEFSVPGSDDPELVTLFPRVAVTTGVPYFVEFSNPGLDGEWAVRAAQRSTDPYAVGRLRINGVFRPSSAGEEFMDLTFRTYGPPSGDPAPRDCAGAGVAPCVSDPEPWVAPRPPGPPPTAAAIREVVEAHADALRPLALGTTGGKAAKQTLYDAFLYRATGDETYAAYVRDEFAEIATRRASYPDEAVPFTWLRHPGWAYRWVRDSPTLDAADHALIRSLLLHAGTRLWDDRELGVWNHALARAVGYRLITDMVPPAEFATLTACGPGTPPACEGLFAAGEQLTADDHADWAAYADGVWTEFTTAWDVLEDSSRYQYYDFGYLLELVELYDPAGQVWNEPGFRALIERLAQYVLPVGAYPVFGDVRGWSQARATPVWLYESAAARWQDPEFRWLSWRFWDYRRAHLGDTTLDGVPIEFEEAVYEEYPSLCHAYFAIDESVPVTAPAGQAEVSSARQDTADGVEWPVGPARIGQTFTAEATPLVRVDVRVRNAGDSSPALLRLWRWAGSHAATVASPPLYAGALPVAGPDEPISVSAFPLLEVEPGATYYVEVGRDAGLVWLGSADAGSDVYPGGGLLVDGAAQGDADAWFRTSVLGDGGSVVTTRLRSTPRRVSEFGMPHRNHDFGAERVPDKLVLRSGYGTDDLHAVVNLVTGDHSHGQIETGAIVSLADGGSLLLIDTAYEDRREKDHNTLLTRRHWGGDHSADVAPLTVSRLVDARRATVAWLDWADPGGWNAEHRRGLYFVKNRFLLVRDRTTFTDSMVASTGSVWHAFDVHPEHGDDWYALGVRRPRGMLNWVFRNPERHALLYLVERPGQSIDQWRVEQDGSPPSASFVAAQRFVGEVASGDAFRFDALLLPFGPQRTPAEVAGDVSVLLDDGAALALKVTLGTEIWTIVDNPSQLSLALPGVATDARYLIASTAADRSGYLLADAASAVEIDDGPGRRILLSWPVTTSVEIADTGRQQDLDGDDTVDALDDDDDGDGVADAVDADPTRADVCSDVDADGCDDCRFGSFDPQHDGPDRDGDGVCRPGDTCPGTPNPGQDDTDLDGFGDACDTCPFVADPGQLDLDGDGAGVQCDNCPLAHNVSQADRDLDGVGDRCDVDDGVIYVTLGPGRLIEWQAEAGTTAWNLYRGDLDTLAALGVYTQEPGADPAVARECGVTAPWTVDTDDPPVGRVAFYLVTGLVDGVETGLGETGAGVPRANANPCPPGPCREFPETAAGGALRPGFIRSKLCF